MNGLLQFFIYTPILFGLFGGASEVPDTLMMLEICDNGIDDDMDGLIDLNDIDDCTCQIETQDVVNIVPNPSFEDYSRCPNSPADIESLDSWVMATETDIPYKYLNKCESSYPDITFGNGAISIYPTRNFMPSHIATCLNRPILKDSNYKLELYVKFDFNNAALFINIYGLPSCENIQDTEECLRASEDWVFIDQMIIISSSNDWKVYRNYIGSDEDFSAIALGANCNSFDLSQTEPYLLDSVTIELITPPTTSCQASFSTDIDCETITMRADAIPSFCTYQWYRNGIALLDSTEHSLSLTNDLSGMYQLRVSGAAECSLSDTFMYNPLNYIVNDGQLYDTICAGEELIIGSDIYTTTGQYQSILNTPFGCDSIVNIYLEVLDSSIQNINRSICLGEDYELNGRHYSQSGYYSGFMRGYNGCDSVVFLTLNVVDTIREEISATVCQGESYKIQGHNFYQPGNYQVPLISINGCDSLILLTLEVKDTTIIHLSDTICSGESSFIIGQGISVAGNYRFNMFNEYGCDSTIFLDLFVSPELTGEINILNPISCHGAQDGSIEINIVNEYSSITWNTSDTTKKISNLITGYYEATVVDNLGCSFVYSKLLAEPLPIFLHVESLNLDCNRDQGALQINNTSGGIEPYTYYINGVEIIDLSSLVDLPESIYHITVRDMENCARDTIIEIQDLRGLGSVDLISSAFSTIYADPVHLIVSMSDIIKPVQITWSGPNLKCFGCIEQSVIPPLGNQTYSIIVIDANGCTFESEVIINSRLGYYIPNSFTPNGDGINDYFTLFTEEYIEIIQQVQIYNRFGDLIFDKQNIAPNIPFLGWDGTYDLHQVPSGVYIYTIKALNNNGQEINISGDITLLK